MDHSTALAIAIKAPTYRYAAAQAHEALPHRAMQGFLLGTILGGFGGLAAAIAAGAAATPVVPGLHAIGDPLLLDALGAMAGMVNGALVGVLIGWSIPRASS